MKITAEPLVEFLQEARANTWAGGQPPAVTPSGEHRYEYAARGLQYRDAYMVTKTAFFGQETVFQADEAVWNMIYAAQIHRKGVKGPGVKAVYAFLQRAVRATVSDNRLGRSVDYAEGEWVYSDRGETHGSEFWGEEWITHRGVEVYRLKYGGGLIPPDKDNERSGRRMG